MNKAVNAEGEFRHRMHWQKGKGREQWKHRCCQKKMARRNWEKWGLAPKAATDITPMLGRRWTPLNLLKRYGICRVTYFKDSSIVYSVWNMWMPVDDGCCSKSLNKWSMEDISKNVFYEQSFNSNQVYKHITNCNYLLFCHDHCLFQS